jgi:hypothetical protein
MHLHTALPARLRHTTGAKPERHILAHDVTRIAACDAPFHPELQRVAPSRVRVLLVSGANTRSSSASRSLKTHARISRTISTNAHNTHSQRHRGRGLGRWHCCACGKNRWGVVTHRQPLNPWPNQTGVDWDWDELRVDVGGSCTPTIIVVHTGGWTPKTCMFHQSFIPFTPCFANTSIHSRLLFHIKRAPSPFIVKA